MKNLSILDVMGKFSNENRSLQVKLNAILVIKSHQAYLTESSEDTPSNQRIEVFCPELESKLDSIVGGWVGGTATYFDTVTIQGEVRKATTRSYALSICNVTEVILTRDDEEYLISFN